MNGQVVSTTEKQMDGEKFYLELSGNLIGGYEQDAVAAALGRLLRMSPQQAVALLQGTPSRIDKQLDAKRALHFLAKITACGAEGKAVPVRMRKEPPPVEQLQRDAAEERLELPPVEEAETASQAGLSLELSPMAEPEAPVEQLELDATEDPRLELPAVEEAETASQAGMTLELSPVDESESPARETVGDEEIGPQEGVTEHAGEMKLELELDSEPEPQREQSEPEDETGGEHAVVQLPDDKDIETVVLESSPLPEEPIAHRDQDTGMGSGGDPGQVYEQPRIATSRQETKRKKQGIDRRLLAVAGLIVLAAAGWGGMQWFGVDDKPSAVISSSAEVENRPQAPMNPELAITRKRLGKLFSSVGVWMIQYGSGFDPSQVTLERMQRDLQIEPEDLLDGWGTPFQYRVDDGSYEIVSAGADRQFNSGDDLRKEKRATR